MKQPSTSKPEILRWLQMQGDADRRILAHLWDVPPDSEPAAIAAAMTDPQRVLDQWQRLPTTDQAVLTRVLQEGGAMPAAIVEREWGEVREPARFPNPRAYLHALEKPASPAERLYMLGFLVRQHDDRGPVFRVLNELRTLLPEPPPRDRTLRVEPQPEPQGVREPPLASLEQTILILLALAYDGALTTLDDGALNVASLRKVAAKLTPGDDLRGIRREANWPWLLFVRKVAMQAGLLRQTSDGVLHVTPEAMQWLGAGQAERAKTLLNGWIACPLNELAIWGGLSWRSEPLSLRLPESRRTVLDLLATLPADHWVRSDDVVAEIERVEPDFLRRDGRYDQALIYDQRRMLVAGRENWERVEGWFIRIVLYRLLHWLGLIVYDDADTPSLIKLTPLAAHLLQHTPLEPEPVPEALIVQATFEVICPPGASLLARFQLGRIAELTSADTATLYRLTRRSVLRASEHGIEPGDILRFLEEHGRGPVPQAVASYIYEWAGLVGQLRLEEAALLRTDDPIRLIELRRARGVDLPPLEELTPTTWKVAPGDTPLLLQQVQRAGFSVTHEGEAAQPGKRSDSKSPLSDHDLKALITAAHAYAHVCAELNLPCEVSSSMLMRLRKLVPSRQIAVAQQTAERVRKQVASGRSATTGQIEDTGTTEGEQ